MVFYVAGTDTTSLFLRMIIYYIAKNPHVEVKLREEIENFMKYNDYSYENLKNFKYAQNIIEETRRMYGPGVHLAPREAIKDNFLGGVPIKKGTMLNVSVFANHYNPEYFKDPFVFRPERWDTECDNVPAFAIGGFSGGARSCIGKHLALMEAKIGLIKFFKRYRDIVVP